MGERCAVLKVLHVDAELVVALNGEGMHLLQTCREEGGGREGEGERERERGRERERERRKVHCSEEDKGEKARWNGVLKRKGLSGMTLLGCREL